MRTTETIATAPEERSTLLPAVDAALEQVIGRGMIAAVEVADLLLDLRSRIVLERGLTPTTDMSQTTKGT